MAAHGIGFQKRFGQNFLINEAIPPRIAAEAARMAVSGGNCSEADKEAGCFLEIGPGIGTLTRELSAAADRVVSVEIDTGLLPVLAGTLADCPNVTVVNADIMKVDLPSFCEEHFGSRPVSLCANLPYNITTPVIMRFLEAGIRLCSITVMVQKEVADRFSSHAGEETYGAVTAAIAYYGRCERLFTVKAGSFLPAPKVDSAVIGISLYPRDAMPVKAADETLFFRTVKAAFSQRRKVLRNTLAAGLSLTREEAVRAIEEAGFPPEIRGECLSAADFARLSDRIGVILSERQKEGAAAPADSKMHN